MKCYVINLHKQALYVPIRTFLSHHCGTNRVFGESMVKICRLYSVLELPCFSLPFLTASTIMSSQASAIVHKKHCCVCPGPQGP